MAVLCEGISVIVRRDSIDHCLEGGWPAFQELVPNATLCSDGTLARVGFMDPRNVEEFVDTLEPLGLELFKDMAVVDQMSGPTRECEWLEFGRFQVGKSEEDKASMCWLFEGERIMGKALYINANAKELHTPPGWQYEGSMSQQFTFVPMEDLEDRMEFLRSDDELDVYRDRATDKEVFVGRPARVPKTFN